MLEGIKILIQRIEANDKDIDDWLDKAQEVMAPVDEHSGEDDQFTDEEKAAVRVAVAAYRRREFNAEIMDMISGEDEAEEEEEETPHKGPMTKKMFISQAKLALIKEMAERDAATAKREGARVWPPF